MASLAVRTGRRRRMLAVLAVTWGVWAAAGVTPGQAATYPLPVKTASGVDESMPDPGVLLYSGNFYAFTTGTGLQESTSSTAAGTWSTPANALQSGQSIPSWIATSKADWAPDMI